MPTQSVSFSNANYQHVLKVANTRGISFSKAVDDMVGDSKTRMDAGMNKETELVDNA